MDPPQNRRGRPRVGALGKATVIRRPGEQVALSIRDLSASGARLVGRVELAEGERVGVSLEIEGAIVSTTALVVRTEPQNSQVAISFDNLSREALGLIERAVEALLERVRAGSPPTVLILSASAETRATLERDLAQLGRATRPCATLLDAVWSLHDWAIRYEAIVIAREADPEPMEELLKHFAEHHPRLRRVLLFRDQLESLGHESSRRVDAVLRTPLRIRALARALGIRETDSSRSMSPVGESDG